MLSTLAMGQIKSFKQDHVYILHTICNQFIMNMFSIDRSIFSIISGLYRAEFVDGQGAVLKHIIIMVIIEDTAPSTSHYSLVILGVEGTNIIIRILFRYFSDFSPITDISQ